MKASALPCPPRPPFRELRVLMRAAGFAPSRSRGQNFLVDERTLARVAEAAEPLGAACVLEVGTGLGFLTRHLAARAPRVVSVEVDGRLHGLAVELAAGWGPARQRVRFLHGDVLGGEDRLAPAVAGEAAAAVQEGLEFVVAGNLPYSVAGPVLASLLLHELPARRMVLLVQEEMACRLLAAPGGREYGPLGILAALAYTCRRVAGVPPQAFRPRPRVQSALVALERRPAALLPAGRPGRELAGFLRALFGGRRKNLRNALRRALELPWGKGRGLPDLEALSLDPSLRPESLPPQRLLALFGAMGGGREA